MRAGPLSPASAVLSAVCLLGAADAAAASLTEAAFGETASGVPVTRYVMQTDAGVRVGFMSYGGTVTDVTTPDRHGRLAPIVLGFRTLAEYETVGAAKELYFGALLGRYANFVARGRFRLDGRAYQLAITDPPNSIHGGRRGFDKRVWHVEPLTTQGRTVSARLTYTSADGEEGYPGELAVTVIYSLSEDGAFTIRYEATTDRDTVLNLSNHMNFDLAGAGSPRGVLDQVLTVDADRYTPTDHTQIPTGALAPVAGTPFDFRRPTAIGARIGEDDEQLAIAGGYDQNWVLNKRGDPTQPQLAVSAYDPASGRTLDCLTTQPGVQIYAATFFDGSVVGVGGVYRRFAAFTLETQHFPDSPNHPAFPTTELRPGEVFRATTIYRFGTRG